MDIIRLLPDSVANQIAAGEVIQRPASCLKELVENSLDAGAGHISVLVRDAGRTLLQVIDDGCGMSETDARMAFERHATSKIRQAADLFSLRTMGFRGEALASICAVAQVEMQTRRKEDEVGTLLEVNGSEVIRQEPCQCPVGTNFRVKNLFYNVPARRKFLKTDQTELRNLLTEFYHIVLVYPKVQFTFVSNDEVLLELPAGTEKQRIEQLFGKGNNKFTGGLVNLETDTDLVSIRGFVGKPEVAGKSAHQYFFVNGRYMRHPYFHKAVMTAYSGMLPGDYAPSYFIYFDIAPEVIDVNIHPTKTEIKFADEQTIFQILMAAVRESLGKFNLAPSLDFDRGGEIEMPAAGYSANAQAPKVVFDPNYNPFKSGSSSHHEQYNHAVAEPAPRNWQQLYSVQPASEVETTLPTLEEKIDFKSITPYQFDGRYILFPTSEGLMMMDQHRAHACILFNMVQQQARHHNVVRQQLLFPEIWEVTTDEQVLLDSLLEDIRDLGFDIDQFSKNSYSISAVPSLMGNKDVQQTLSDMLHAVSELGTDVRSQWMKRIAYRLALSGAIPYGKILNVEEQRDLVERLMSLPEHTYTPDGKRVISLFSHDEITKRF